MTEDIASAARRIVEQHWNPVNYDLFCDDATVVASAFLQLLEKNIALVKALREEIERWETDERVLYPDNEVLASLARILSNHGADDGR